MFKKNMDNRNEKENTIRDVANLAGVSVATAGRVLGGYGSASSKSVSAVKDAAAKLNYIPNGIAQSMKKKNTKTIGLIIANISNPYFSSIARLVEEVLAKEGYNLIICNTDEDSERELSYLRTLYEKRVDGLMIASALKDSESSEDEVLKMYKNSIPTIIIDREIPGIDLPTVTSDNFRGAYEATTHLIKMGHKKIGVIGSNISTLFRRVDGYKQAMEENFLTFDDYLISNKTYDNVSPGDVNEGIFATRELLKDPETRPTAIFPLNNLLTTGALIAIDEMGLRIPEDVAIVGWDDFDLAPLLKPPITVVKQSSYNIANIATNRLLELISNSSLSSEADKKVTLSTELVVRGSCGNKAN
ncbi:LacI family DNA-binding transcriptional regulator [Bacillus canaveralius]|nr:LacI family DNA-binding transcriptional regulator [Bacillus canaveralius]